METAAGAAGPAGRSDQKTASVSRDLGDSYRKIGSYVNGAGVGELLLTDALARCVRVASEIAASLIVADSKGNAASSSVGASGR